MDDRTWALDLKYKDPVVYEQEFIRRYPFLRGKVFVPRDVFISFAPPSTKGIDPVHPSQLEADPAVPVPKGEPKEVRMNMIKKCDVCGRDIKSLVAYLAHVKKCRKDQARKARENGEPKLP